MPKPSNNGFATFMVDYRKREERNGRKFRALDEVVPFAGVEWSKMTPEQKAFYKDKARDYRTSEECRLKVREIRNKPAKPKPAVAKMKTCTSSTDESFADDNYAFFVRIFLFRSKNLFKKFVFPFLVRQIRRR